MTQVEPTPTPTLIPTATATPAPLPTATPDPVSPKVDQLPDPMALPHIHGATLFVWGGVGALGVCLLGYLVSRWRGVAVEDSVRVGLVGYAGSWMGYVILVALCRWLLPVWLYRLIGREALAGAVAAAGGSLSFLGIISIRWGERRVLARRRAARGDHRDPVEAASRE